MRTSSTPGILPSATGLVTGRWLLLALAAAAAMAASPASAVPFHYNESYAGGNFTYSFPDGSLGVGRLGVDAPGAAARTHAESYQAAQTGGALEGGPVWDDAQQGTAPTSSFDDTEVGGNPILCVDVCDFHTLFASADVATGTMKAKSSVSVVAGPPGDSEGEASVVLYDRITLSQDATVILSGSLAGALSRLDMSGSFLGYPFVDFTAGFSTGVPEYNKFTDLGGVVLPCQSFDSCASHGAQSFSVAIQLPGNTPIDFNAGLFTYAEAYADGTQNWPVGSGEADFSHTASFQLLVPEGVQVTSATGLLPVAMVPEPSTGSLVVAGSAALLLVRRKTT
jgi:hypothetical protein